MSKELWQQINNNYEVSTFGSIRNIKTGRILKPYITTTGYLATRMGGNCKTFKIHRLIAKTFIPNPDNKPCINHKDGNRLNNKIENLEWCTIKENNQDAWEKGRCFNYGETHCHTHLKNKDIKKIRKIYNPLAIRHSENYISQLTLAKMFGVSQSVVSDIITRKSWTRV